MFLDHEEKRKQLSKWIVGTVAVCILIFLGIRYIPAIAYAITWLVDLVKPILIGTVIALVLDVPLCSVERHLFKRHPSRRKEKLKRPLGILLSLILVFGIFIGVAVLVIPELLKAISMISTSVMNLLDQIAALETSTDFSSLPFGEYLSRIEIDWLELKNSLSLWLKEAIILGTLCTIGMLILRLPYAPMIGALVGVTALIPYVGAFIATIIGAFLILTVNPFKAVVFVIFLLALQQVEGNLIYPRVVGAKINLPGMWVLAAITIGGNLAGPIGMLMGVPVTSAVYALLKEATDKQEARSELPKKVEQKAGRETDC